MGHFIKAKLHRRNKAKRHIRKIKFGIDQTLIRASEDYKLHPHECKPIRVDGNFKEDSDWLVEKNLLTNANDSFFAIPNVLISAKNPWVPVTNPSDHPRYIRKGEIIGSIKNPQEFFDSPRNEEEWGTWVAHTNIIDTMIKAQSELVNKCNTDANPEEEEYGPKTAAMPDPIFGARTTNRHRISARSSES